MKKNPQFIEIDRQTMHSLLFALTLVRVRGRKILKPGKRHGESLEIGQGVTVVERRIDRESPGPIGGPLSQ